jgi:hypothetical protein
MQTQQPFVDANQHGEFNSASGSNSPDPTRIDGTADENDQETALQLSNSASACEAATRRRKKRRVTEMRSATNNGGGSVGT